MRNHHAHASGIRFQRFNHVQDEGIVALGFGRNPTAETAEFVIFRVIMPPFIQ